MNPQNFNRIISEKSGLDAMRTRELSAIVEEFPYFQAARALQLKGLYQNHSFLYNEALKVTAAYTTDRSVLFEYITSEEFRQHDISENIKRRREEDGFEEIEEDEWMAPEEAHRILDPNLFEEQTEKKPDSETGEIEEVQKQEVAENLEEETTAVPKENLSFAKNEERSFSEWLKLTKAKPIQREEKEPDNPKIAREQEIIDRFIESEPKIVSGKSVGKEIILRDYEPASPLMTETLAKIYAEQKNYSKAIQAYKILILKNPEKSSLFANRIRDLENLIENKNK